MLKRVALAGIVGVLIVSALSLATARTFSNKTEDKNAVTTPQPPIPRGFCLPPSGRC